MATVVKNTIIASKEEPKVRVPKPEKAPKSAFILWLSKLISGSFLEGQKVTKQVPFILCIAFLAMIYIGNNYNAQKTAIAINKTRKEIEGLRYEYISTKANLMYISKQSEIVKRLGGSGLKEAIVPPEKIFIEESE
jgi:preprotein translocase subunit SecY